MDYHGYLGIFFLLVLVHKQHKSFHFSHPFSIENLAYELEKGLREAVDETNTLLVSIEDLSLDLACCA